MILLALVVAGAALLVHVLRPHTLMLRRLWAIARGQPPGQAQGRGIQTPGNTGVRG